MGVHQNGARGWGRKWGGGSCYTAPSLEVLVTAVPLLISGLVLFFLPHLFRELGLREKLIARLNSENAYKGIYSLLALAGLALIIVGKGQSEFVMVWEPRFELRQISHILMLPALLLVVAGNLPTSRLRAAVRNPMMLGTLLWGIAHLWSNGDLASILLFGGFALWSGFKFVSLGIHNGPVTSTPSQLWDGIAVVIGLVLYGLIAIFHGELFGVGLSFAS